MNIPYPVRFLPPQLPTPAERGSKWGAVRPPWLYQTRPSFGAFTHPVLPACSTVLPKWFTDSKLRWGEWWCVLTRCHGVHRAYMVMVSGSYWSPAGCCDWVCWDVGGWEEHSGQQVYSGEDEKTNKRKKVSDKNCVMIFKKQKTKKTTQNHRKKAQL